MSTLLILIGFALMLFVPVAVAMLRVRERDGDASRSLMYADRGMHRRVAERLMALALPNGFAVAPVARVAQATQVAQATEARDWASASQVQAEDWAGVTSAQVEAMSDEELQMNILVDQAHASRAYAEDLLMLARAAMERAEAADAEARGYERDAERAAAARRAA